MTDMQPTQQVRLDEAMVILGLAHTRSHAALLIKLNKVKVGSSVVGKPGKMVYLKSNIEIIGGEEYVSRAGFKLASVSEALKLDFRGKVMLDVGSSTGGFTDYALQHGAGRVIAVEVGTDQLHPSLRNDVRIELHEQTDIRDVHELSSAPDIVVIDVSFISLREVLPHIATLCKPTTNIVAMVKPQFEAGNNAKHKGVIKNDRMRRDILQEFENWAKKYFITIQKADSQIAGEKGNLERFYLLRKVA